jgi:uncharacterized delta-60 repeat protein
MKPQLAATALLGALVMAGSAAQGQTGGNPSYFAVARYDKHGTLDDDYASAGVELVRFSGFEDGARALAMDGLARPVVAGSAGDARRALRVALFRLERTGWLDDDFGRDGAIQTDLTSSTTEAARGLVLDNMARPTVAGRAEVGGVDHFMLLRYSRNGGGLDRDFGVGGVTLTAFPSAEAATARALALDSLGRIIVVGEVVADGRASVAVARYDRGGALDSSFGLGGLAVLPFPGGSSAGARAVAIDHLNRVVVAGYGTVGGWSAMALLRLSGSGHLDQDFGDRGWAVTALSGDAWANDVAIDWLGRPTVAGTLAHRMGGASIVLARYDRDGTPDSSYGSRGTSVTAFPGYSAAWANALALDHMARAVVVGGAQESSGQADFALARFDLEGRLDPAFGSAGRVVSSVLAGGCAQAWDVEIDWMGRPTVAGGAHEGGCRTDGYRPPRWPRPAPTRPAPAGSTDSPSGPTEGTTGTPISSGCANQTAGANWGGQGNVRWWIF